MIPQALLHPLSPMALTGCPVALVVHKQGERGLPLPCLVSNNGWGSVPRTGRKTDPGQASGWRSLLWEETEVWNPLDRDWQPESWRHRLIMELWPGDMQAELIISWTGPWTLLPEDFTILENHRRKKCPCSCSMTSECPLLPKGSSFGLL